MSPSSDLVQESKLETSFSPTYTRHTFYKRGTSGREWRIRVQENWTRKRRLGQGAYGTVWLETCNRPARRHGPTVRAVKEIPIDSGLTEKVDYFRELEAVIKFSQERYTPSFVESYGWFESPEAIFIAMEYVPYGDLQNYLSSPIPEDEARIVTRQLAEGLHHMHTNGFTHRDLKPGNILVVSRGPDWLVQISDFGISRRLRPDQYTLGTLRRGTIGFIAPEMLGFVCDRSEPYAVDIWSLGAVVFRMVTEKLFMTDFGLLHKYIAAELQFPSDDLTSCGVTESLASFLGRLLSPSPNRRPTITEILSHDWLQHYPHPSKIGASKAHSLGSISLADDSLRDDSSKTDSSEQSSSPEEDSSAEEDSLEEDSSEERSSGEDTPEGDSSDDDASEDDSSDSGIQSQDEASPSEDAGDVASAAWSTATICIKTAHQTQNATAAIIPSTTDPITPGSTLFLGGNISQAPEKQQQYSTHRPSPSEDNYKPKLKHPPRERSETPNKSTALVSLNRSKSHREKQRNDTPSAKPSMRSKRQKGSLAIMWPWSSTFFSKTLSSKKSKSTSKRHTPVPKRSKATAHETSNMKDLVARSEAYMDKPREVKALICLPPPCLQATPTHENSTSNSKQRVVRFAATQIYADKYHIPPKYDLSRWNPSKRPLLFLYCVFDLVSIGTWLNHTIVSCQQHDQSISNDDIEAIQDLAILLEKLDDSLSKAVEKSTHLHKADDREASRDLTNSGVLLVKKVQRFLQSWQGMMSLEDRLVADLSWEGNRLESAAMKYLGTEKLRSKTENLEQSLRLWVLRYDASCSGLIKLAKVEKR